MGKLKPLNIYSLVCLIAYLYQSVEWPSLVCYDYDVTKVCSVDRLPITDFSRDSLGQGKPLIWSWGPDSKCCINIKRTASLLGLLHSLQLQKHHVVICSKTCTGHKMIFSDHCVLLFTKSMGVSRTLSYLVFL